MNAFLERVPGLVALALGVWLIARREEEARKPIQFQNRLFSVLGLKTRYGEKAVRHNVRAAVVVGILFVLLGIYFFVAGFDPRPR